MSKVWVTIPSARPVAEVNAFCERWHAMGYAIALWRDDPYSPEGKVHAVDCAKMPSDIKCDIMLVANTYPGYAVACNTLIKHVMEKDPESAWYICCGDDTFPDPTKRADEIAAECEYHFGASAFGHSTTIGGTFGIMQPTGDVGFGDAQGPYIQRVAGSPFIGRAFAERMYDGKGPYWPEYTHMGVDEEIMAVAVKYGVFWKRPDLTHYHDHWGRPREGERLGMRERMPAFLAEANSPQHWQRYKQIFESRQAAGFPGSEPIA